MTRYWRHIPFFVVLMGLATLAMIPPAILAYSAREMHIARSFFYLSILFLTIVAMISCATHQRHRRSDARAQLITLFSAFGALPVMLAVPFHQGLQTTSFVNAYFEMVSSLTTTGATLFDDPERLSDALHLWRGLVGWLGGLLIWVVAGAILSPLNLGGYEVATARDASRVGARFAQIYESQSSQDRVMRAFWMIGPIYTGLTIGLAALILADGAAPLTATMLAMSTLATSGITASDTLTTAPSFVSEAAILVFFVFAFSRESLLSLSRQSVRPILRRDPELKVAFALLLGVTLILFLRHWSGALDVRDEANALAAAKAVWGALFTTASFLSTSGLESAWWDSARDWSGLSTPGLVLMALCLIGGGVATSAGGVKLLRIYALYKHGGRETERLVLPSSVGGAGREARRIRREGAFIAWVFFMLFAVSLAVTMLLLSMNGVSFESAMILSASALANTGPLANVAASTPLSYAALSDAAKLTLCAAMVIGRLEALAIIALLNPAFWRA